MDDRFFNAFLPPSARIAGRRVFRFSLWHQFLLAAIDSPAATGVGHFTPADLLAAVKICRSSYGPPPSMDPSLLDVWWTWRFKRNPRLFRDHAERFFRWMAIQSSPPRYWRASSGGSESVKSFTLDNGPRVLGIVASLMTRAGLTRAEAWDTPAGEARWLDAVIAKNEGVPLNFLDDADLEDPEPLSFDTMTEEEVEAQLRADGLPEAVIMSTIENLRAKRGGRKC